MAQTAGSSSAPRDPTRDDEVGSGNELLTAVGSAKPANRIFTLFPKLPPELRCRIWQFALPSPRTVEIRSPEAAGTARESSPQPYLCRPCCDETVPSIFWVCKEARAEVCKTYTPLRGSQPGSAVVWVDFGKDTVRFKLTRFLENSLHWNNLEAFLSLLPSEILMSIRFFSVEAEMLAFFCLADEEVLPMKQLKTFALSLEPVQRIVQPWPIPRLVLDFRTRSRRAGSLKMGRQLSNHPIS